jgi:hypothetical protein
MKTNRPKTCRNNSRIVILLHAIALLLAAFVFFSDFFSWEMIHLRMSCSEFDELYSRKILKYAGIKCYGGGGISAGETTTMHLGNLSYIKLTVVGKIFFGSQFSTDVLDE